MLMFHFNVLQYHISMNRIVESTTDVEPSSESLAQRMKGKGFKSLVNFGVV